MHAHMKWQSISEADCGFMPHLNISCTTPPVIATLYLARINTIISHYLSVTMPDDVISVYFLLMYGHLLQL